MRTLPFSRLASVTAFAAVLAVASPAPVRAQDPAPPQARGGQAPARPGRGAAKDQGANPLQVSREVQDMLDTMVLSQAQSALALTEDQYPLFFRRMQAFQRVQRQHQMRRLQLINEINQLTKPGVSTADDVLAARTKALDDLESEMGQQEHDAMTAIDQTMTIRQRARLRVFLENMERTKVRLIAQAMRLGGTVPPAPAPGPGRGR